MSFFFWPRYVSHILTHTYISSHTVTYFLSQTLTELHIFSFRQLQILSLSLSYTYTHSRIYKKNFSHKHSHTFSLSLSHTYTHFISCSYSHFLSHTLTFSLTYAFSHRHTLMFLTNPYIYNIYIHSEQLYICIFWILII